MLYFILLPPLYRHREGKLHDSDHAFLYVLCHSYITYAAIIISYTGRDIYCKALIYTINIYYLAYYSGETPNTSVLVAAVPAPATERRQK